MRGFVGRRRFAPLSLSPLSDVSVRGDDLVATAGEPWLELHGVDLAALRGRFVELTFRASLLDQPARPVIRFTLDDGSWTDRICAAAIAGAGIWIGRVPPATRRIALSPTNQLGVFGFEVEAIRRRRWPRLLLVGVVRRFRQTRSSMLTRLIGWKPESDNNLAWATGAIDFAAYRGWLARRRRPIEAGVLDRPRHDWSAAAPIVLVLGATDRRQLRRTLAALHAQLFTNWRVVVIGAVGGAGGGHDPRLTTSDLAGAVELLGSLTAATLVGLLEPGDTLPPHALAFLAEQRHLHPLVRLFYGDEVAAGRPVLKPGWSPRLMAARPYLGRAVFVGATRDWSWDERRAFLAEAALPARLVSAADAIRPLRRILVKTRGVTSAPARAPAVARVAAGRAAIIIPTCDQPALLRRVVASIRRKSPPTPYRMVIVDNGHAGGVARRMVDELAGNGDVLLLRRPDSFNFSGFCNDAAAACDEDLLVFLNDDMEVLSDDWLNRLAGHASDPRIGAVGAKLTFPDGRLQHVGVLVGMGGSAGHLGAMARGDDPGWLGRNTVVHEVSAVTGACLAVSREKFLAVGGFDAENLPVELSDVDLCLKLNARGWQTVIDPAVHLLHEESASRGGATFRRLDKYSRQRAIFVERWRHVLRDDPAFHPGLSLYSLQAALG